MECNSCEYEGLLSDFEYICHAKGIGSVEIRKCPRCGAQLQCNPFTELEIEIPAQLKKARELIKKEKFKEAKIAINDASMKNRQRGLPGIEDEVRVLYKELKGKRAKTKNVAQWAT